MFSIPKRILTLDGTFTRAVREIMTKNILAFGAEGFRAGTGLLRASLDTRIQSYCGKSKRGRREKSYNAQLRALHASSPYHFNK